jgi:cytochrome P450
VNREDQPIARSYRHFAQPGGGAELLVVLEYFLPVLKLLPVPINVSLADARRTIRDTALSMILRKQQEAIDNEGRGQRDILGVMIEENRKNREKGIPNDALTEEEMVSQIMTFLAAGYDFDDSPMLI